MSEKVDDKGFGEVAAAIGAALADVTRDWGVTPEMIGRALEEQKRAMTETLTAEERENLEHGFKRRAAEQLIAKVLRIHDAQAERIRELESRSPMVHLDHVPTREEREVLRDLLAPYDLVQQDPAKMPTLAGAKLGRLTNNAGVRAATAEARVRELEALLAEAANCMGLDAIDMVERIDAALGLKRRVDPPEPPR